MPSGNIYAWGNRSPATKDQYLDAIYGAHVRVGSISFEEACPTIPRNNLLETYMQPCDACCDLVGKPSSVPPHGDLAASGVIAVGPPGNMTKVSSSWNARSAATGCTKTRRMEIRRTNGLLANDRQTGRQNDGHVLCVAHTGDDQRNARLGRHRFVSLTRMTWISCANKWAIE